MIAKVQRPMGFPNLNGDRLAKLEGRAVGAIHGQDGDFAKGKCGSVRCDLFICDEFVGVFCAGQMKHGAGVA